MILAPLLGLLRSPSLYIRWQRILGAYRLRQICLDDVLKLREGERVLDIGCGPGYILDYMPRVDYVGFDTEPRYIEYAREHYRDRGRFFCEHFAQAHVTKFKPFDAIMLLGIVHHIMTLRPKICSGCWRNAWRQTGASSHSIRALTSTQSRFARWVAKADRGGFVRNERAYRRLGADQFADVEGRLVNNICRIPSTELIMRLGRPLEPKPI